MKLLQLFVFIITFTTSTYTFSASPQESMHIINDPSGTDIIAESVVRPFALFVGLPIGAALFAVRQRAINNPPF